MIPPGRRFGSISMAETVYWFISVFIKNASVFKRSFLYFISIHFLK